MTEAIFMYSGAPKLGPVLNDVVTRVTDLMKLEVVQGLAADHQPALFRASATRSIDGREVPTAGTIVARRLRSLPPEGKRGVRDFSKVPALRLAATSEVRHLARTYNVDLASERSPFEQVDAQAFRFAATDLLEPATVASRHRNLFSIGAGGGGVGDATALAAATAVPGGAGRLDLTAAGLLRDRPTLTAAGRLQGAGGIPPIVLNRGLRFRLHEVRCVDETNPEWPGSDEISMGGVTTDAKGATAQITEFMVGTGFDDGDTKVYSPPRVIHTFSLDGLTYPADFLVTVALAEKDNGGMSTFIRELWEAIKSHVTTIVTTLSMSLGGTLGGQIGGTIGTGLAGPLGSIIGAVVGAVLGALVAWLINALQDDIFRPQAAAIRLPHPQSRFDGGSATSPVMALDFEDHGGLYRVLYSWEVVR